MQIMHQRTESEERAKYSGPDYLVFFHFFMESVIVSTMLALGV